MNGPTRCISALLVGLLDMFTYKLIFTRAKFQKGSARSVTEEHPRIN
jgi:hypothetical protein